MSMLDCKAEEVQVGDMILADRNAPIPEDEEAFAKAAVTVEAVGDWTDPAAEGDDAHDLHGDLVGRTFSTRDHNGDEGLLNLRTGDTVRTLRDSGPASDG